MLQIANLRKHHDEIMEHTTYLKDYLSNKLEEIPVNNTIFKDTFVVVDTNIFLSHLSTIRKIMNISLNGKFKDFIINMLSIRSNY